MKSLEFTELKKYWIIKKKIGDQNILKFVI